MISIGELGGIGESSAQEARRERPVRQEREAALTAKREESLLRVAIEDVVRPLVSGDRRERERAGELQVARVAQADRACLPLLLQPVEGLEARLPSLRNLVQLHEIDVIGAHSLERLVERMARVVARSDFRGDVDRVAMGSQ